VDISRITPSHTAFRMKVLGENASGGGGFVGVGGDPPLLPFLSVPLRHGDKGVGVLSLDSISRLPRAPYDPHPEPSMLLFLQQVGKLLGGFLDLQSKRKVNLVMFAPLPPLLSLPCVPILCLLTPPLFPYPLVSQGHRQGDRQRKFQFGRSIRCCLPFLDRCYAPPRCRHCCTYRV